MKETLDMDLRAQVGLLECFRQGDYEHVRQTLDDLKKLHVKSIKTILSWTDLSTDEGAAWASWLMSTLSKEVEVLPSFMVSTPVAGTTALEQSGLPYLDALVAFLESAGMGFNWVELWLDPKALPLKHGHETYTDTLLALVAACKAMGKKILWTGYNASEIELIAPLLHPQLLHNIDAVGLVSLSENKESLKAIQLLQKLLERNNSAAHIWMGAYGYSTWKYEERQQLEDFIKTATLPIQRIYWYALKDREHEQSSVSGYSRDDRDYFFGMKKHDGSPKLLYRMLEKYGLDNLDKARWVSKSTSKAEGSKQVLIFGGAGFIGTNVAQHQLMLGKPVTIFDNLSRPGVEENLKWLVDTYGSDVSIRVADIRNPYAVHSAVKNAEQIFHFAAQVAVTTSLNNPKEDFDINAAGTLNILNAMQSMETPPSLLFTSTNKVYGGLEDVALTIHNDRYLPMTEELRKRGISEKRNLDFHSPYGCSKGTADQYVIDYARTFQLPAAVFRMSCIYGPHQYGTEDQGWVAHFVISTLKNKLVNIYGDGRQVRDLLFVEDLVEACMLAQSHMGSIAGEAFNIGGGPANAIGVAEVFKYLSRLAHNSPKVEYGDWRPGDQRYYVSDTGKFELATGWAAKTSVKDGITKLYEWLKEYHESVKQVQLMH